jgi:hypothetical protein
MKVLDITPSNPGYLYFLSAFSLLASASANRNSRETGEIQEKLL